MTLEWIVPCVVLAGVLLAASGAAAHEGHAHKFMGTVPAGKTMTAQSVELSAGQVAAARQH